MGAKNTDLLLKIAPNTGWQLGASGVADGEVETIGLISAAGLPTDTAVLLTIDRVNQSGAKTPSKMERIIGVVSGDNLVNCIRGVEGTAQGHSGGAVVEIVICADNINKLMQAILAEHNQDGTHNIPFKTFQGNIHAPEGFLLNGKIVPSVDNNNLTVAVKTLSGDNPSVLNPVQIRIDGAMRTITSALSITRNAGTNWFNCGSAELAGKEVDYFVYLGYNEEDGVVLGFSRISSFFLYGDSSITDISEQYMAVSNISNADPNDSYTVIGRFCAILSSSSEYTWSIPTFTNINLIQRPICESRWLDFSSIPSGFLVDPSINEHKYKVAPGKVFISLIAGNSVLGQPGGGICSLTVPFLVPDSFGYIAAPGNNNNLNTIVVISVDSGNKLKIRSSDLNHLTATCAYRGSVIIMEI